MTIARPIGTMLLAQAILAAMPATASAQGDPPSPTTIAANAAFMQGLAPDDAEEREAANHGFIGTQSERYIRDAQGKIVWDLEAYAFIEGAPPPTVNPSLWRQAKLVRLHGLFKVADRVYQVRGFDAANLTLIVGDTGFIILDPMMQTESAAAAMALVRRHLGDKPVRAVVYSHSHTDHFGGVRGVVTQAAVDSGAVQIIAPTGFIDGLFGNQVMVGNAVGRRVQYQVGIGLEPGVRGAMTNGTGTGPGSGTHALIPPTRSIARTGETLSIDGVTLEFQMTPGTEAPAEMNVYVPTLKTLFLAENANATMHNLLPPRGEFVRDANAWARYLEESLARYGDRTDTLVLAHGWPRVGNAQVRRFIADHSDLYQYVHDQTVRMINSGLKPQEIVEAFSLPPAIGNKWYNRGYYGSLRFNIRAVYQRYLGWYDADPASLDPLPPVEEGRRYVAAMGGGAAVMRMGTEAIDKGEYRWAATILDHLVMSEPDNAPARELLARAYTQMAYQSENAVWRSIYLMGAAELRGGPRGRNLLAGDMGVIAGLPTSAIFDLLAVRMDPAKVQERPLRVRLIFPERREDLLVTVRNDILRSTSYDGGAVDATLSIAREPFLRAVFAGKGDDLVAQGQVQGDRAAIARIPGMFTVPSPSFPIVTSAAGAVAGR